MLALKACARSPIYPTLIVSAAIFLLSAAVFFFTLLHPLFCRVKRDGLFRLFSFEKYLPYTSSCFHFGLPAAISVRVFPHCGCILPLSILRDRDIPKIISFWTIVSRDTFFWNFLSNFLFLPPFSFSRNERPLVTITSYFFVSLAS